MSKILNRVIVQIGFDKNAPKLRSPWLEIDECRRFACQLFTILSEKFTLTIESSEDIEE